VKAIKYLGDFSMMIPFFAAQGQTVIDQKIIDDAVEAKGMLLKADKGLKAFLDESAGDVILPKAGFMADASVTFTYYTSLVLKKHKELVH